MAAPASTCIDNTSEGHSFNVTAQLRKTLAPSASAGLGYSYTDAKNNLKSTEIASVLWQNQPVQGDPNNPELSFSEFGQRHRIVGDATYMKPWSPSCGPSSASSSRSRKGTASPARAATGTRSSTPAT